MLNFNRRDVPDPKDAGKPIGKPSLYEPTANTARPSAGIATRPPNQSAPAVRETPSTPALAARENAVPAVPAAPLPAATTTTAAVETPGSKLSIGVNIKLKGVEISDCDVLVIEGHVEATVHSKVMQIAKPGTLKGTALIDVAEIHGDFSGELTARTRLVVHGTGRVSGTIRYGKLIVEEGGELSGDVKRMDENAEPAQSSRMPAQDSRYLSGSANPIGSD